MSETENDLMQAILRDPADDLPRLVFAEWLEENGEPERAEFIRLQIHDPKRWCPVDYHPWMQKASLLDVSKSGLKTGDVRMSRGFPSSISCSLAVLMGRAICEKCEGGRYVMMVPNRRIEAGELVSPADGHIHPCPHCTDGRTPGLVDALGRRWPITSIAFAGMEPVHRHNPEDWGWSFAHSIQPGYDPHFIPPEVWKHMKGEVYASHWKIYHARAAALAALSDACVALLRERAGLPPLHTAVARAASAARPELVTMEG